MPQIRHPKTKAVTEVPAAVVEHWTERAGWELVDAPQKPRALLVLARTKADADAYLRSAEHPARGSYVGDAAALRGHTPETADLVELPGFAEHRKHDALVTELLASGFRLQPTDTPPLGGGEDDPGTDSSTTTEKE